MPLSSRSPLDTIRIHQLAVECIVGIRPRERRVEQPVVIDIELGVDTRDAARSGRITQTVDYAQVEVCVSAMLQFRKYQLIESAAEELCAMLIGTHPQLQEVMIRIEKPQALAGKARAASVEVKRGREDFPAELIATVQTAGVLRAERLWLSEEAELSLITLAPSTRWQPSLAPGRRAIDWLVSGRLDTEGKTVEQGMVRTSACSGVAPWANNDASEAVLFRCLAAEATG